MSHLLHQLNANCFVTASLISRFVFTPKINYTRKSRVIHPHSQHISKTMPSNPIVILCIGQSMKMFNIERFQCRNALYPRPRPVSLNFFSSCTAWID